MRSQSRLQLELSSPEGLIGAGKAYLQGGSVTWLASCWWEGSAPLHVDFSVGCLKISSQLGNWLPVDQMRDQMKERERERRYR